MSTLSRQFAEEAIKFCRWAEAAGKSAQEEAAFALSILPRLYSLALQLPAAESAEDAPEVTHEQWHLVFKRFGSLPFNYYSVCTEPFTVPEGEVAVADLADDLADIWRDLRRGLALFEAGRQEAATYEWRETFEIHWGAHLVSALRVLHIWVAQSDAGVYAQQAVQGPTSPPSAGPRP